MDTKKRKPHKITLAGEILNLEFTLASLLFLTEKNPDLVEFLKIAGGDGLKGAARANPKRIKAVAQLIYAGLIRADDDGNDTSGWTVARVLNSVHQAEFPVIEGAMWEAWIDGGVSSTPQTAAKA